MWSRVKHEKNNNNKMHPLPVMQSTDLTKTEIEHYKNFNFELFKKEIESLGNYKVEI